jgi:hypothetical protein
MAMTCDVPTCPAVPEFGKALCPLHTRARLAQALGLAGSAAGKGAKPCLLCDRHFKPLDWVLLAKERRDPLSKTGRPHKGEPIGYVHVACAPRVRKPSRKKAREAAKPLFLGLEQ